MNFTVSDLCEYPIFFDTIADRIWRAWWKLQGPSLDKVHGALGKALSDRTTTFALIAHVGEQYWGSTLGIASDLKDRPQYSPWVAAVWVDPEHRRKNVGRTLVQAARQSLFNLGARRVYLCSPPERRNFYTRQGWVPIEENVGSDHQIIYTFDSIGPSRSVI